jgi:hypothetical protein
MLWMIGRRHVGQQQMTQPIIFEVFRCSCLREDQEGFRTIEERKYEMPIEKVSQKCTCLVARFQFDGIRLTMSLQA